MKTKITAKRLVRALYLEAEEHKMNSSQRASYFLYGYEQAIKEGMDQLEYWRSALTACPDMVDKIHEKLFDKNVDQSVKDFIKKMALLK